MPADLDVAELRRQVVAWIEERDGGAEAGDETFALMADLAHALDRIAELEARVVDLVNELDDERVAYAELLASPEDPAAPAGEQPGSEPASSVGEYVANGEELRRWHDGSAPESGDPHG